MPKTHRATLDLEQVWLNFKVKSVGSAGNNDNSSLKSSKKFLDILQTFDNLFMGYWTYPKHEPRKCRYMYKKYY